jgi:hypothetical protein
MKHKYTISRDVAAGQLTVREYAELDKEQMSLLCEERYADSDITSALDAGREQLVGILRTRNMFPPAHYAARIAEAIGRIYASDDTATVEVVVDDKDFLIKESAGKVPEEKPNDGIDEEIDNDSDELDGILAGADTISSSGPMKIAEDDSAGLDDD